MVEIGEHREQKCCIMGNEYIQQSVANVQIEAIAYTINNNKLLKNRIVCLTAIKIPILCNVIKSNNFICY